MPTPGHETLTRSIMAPQSPVESFLAWFDNQAPEVRRTLVMTLKNYFPDRLMALSANLSQKNTIESDFRRAVREFPEVWWHQVGLAAILADAADLMFQSVGDRREQEALCRAGVDQYTRLAAEAVDLRKKAMYAEMAALDQRRLDEVTLSGRRWDWDEARTTWGERRRAELSTNVVFRWFEQKQRSGAATGAELAVSEQMIEQELIVTSIHLTRAVESVLRRHGSLRDALLEASDEYLSEIPGAGLPEELCQKLVELQRALKALAKNPPERSAQQVALDLLEVHAHIARAAVRAE